MIINKSITSIYLEDDNYYRVNYRSIDKMMELFIKNKFMEYNFNNNKFKGKIKEVMTKIIDNPYILETYLNKLKHNINFGIRKGNVVEIYKEFDRIENEILYFRLIRFKALSSTNIKIEVVESSIGFRLSNLSKDERNSLIEEYKNGIFEGANLLGIDSIKVEKHLSKLLYNDSKSIEILKRELDDRFNHFYESHIGLIDNEFKLINDYVYYSDFIMDGNMGKLSFSVKINGIDNYLSIYPDINNKDKSLTYRLSIRK